MSNLKNGLKMYPNLTLREKFNFPFAAVEIGNNVTRQQFSKFTSNIPELSLELLDDCDPRSVNYMSVFALMLKFKSCGKEYCGKECSYK